MRSSVHILVVKNLSENPYGIDLRALTLHTGHVDHKLMICGFGSRVFVHHAVENIPNTVLVIPKSTQNTVCPRHGAAGDTQ